MTNPLGTGATRTVVPNLWLANGLLNPEAMRFYRNQHRINQRQLGQLLGLSVNTISSMEQGKRTPSTRTVALLENFARATHEIMAEHGGIVPPSKQFRNYFESSDEERDELMKEMMVSSNDTVRKLRAENKALKMRIYDLEQEIADLRRVNTSELGRIEREFERRLREVKEMVV